MQVALQYADDRKSKQLQDERERIARDARVAVARVRTTSVAPDTEDDEDDARSQKHMPGSGHRLNAAADDATDVDKAGSDDDDD
jgi:hypothetical protein